MSGSRQVQVRLHPDGTITGETIGIKGPSCLSALTLLEALIGGTVIDSSFTNEFYEHEEALTSAIAVEEASTIGNQ